MKKTIVRYGTYSVFTICTLMLIAWFLLNELPFSVQEVIGYSSMIVSLLFVYFGIRYYRDSENEGIISFGKAVLIGILISLIAATAFGILDVIYVTYLNPNFMTDYYNITIEEMRTTLSAAVFETKLADMEAQKELFMNPIMNFLFMFATVLIIGFIISLISGLLLQKKSSSQL